MPEKESVGAEQEMYYLPFGMEEKRK